MKHDSKNVLVTKSFFYLTLLVLIGFISGIQPVQAGTTWQESHPDQKKSDEKAKSTEEKNSDDSELSKIVEKHAASKFVPGIVAAIAEKGKPIRKAAAGVLKNKTEFSLKSDHIIHLGSCTKAMTTALIARLVDKGKVKWTTTVIEAAPHLADQIHEDYHNITFVELLSHQSGLPANAKFWFLNHKEPARDARLAILKANLKSKIRPKARGKFVYSNLGYMLAGYMAATVEKSNWEDLIRKEVFGPLKMKSAGFGPPSVKGNTDQPWGHSVNFLGAISKTQIDNAPALGPAGTAHMKVEDWAKFGLALAVPKESIAKDAKQSGFLSAKSLKRIHSLVQNDVSKKTKYGLGWIILDRKWANGPVLYHNGSNTYWYAEIWVAPEREACFLAVTNSAGSASSRAIRNTITDLMKLYTKKSK